jgi:hypothetical protein
MAKGVARSELVRDVTSAAAVGAVIAVPIPLVGPMAGAVVGGTLGAYKNLKSPSSRRFEPVIPESGGAAPVPVYKDPDIYEKLIKFDDLRKKAFLPTLSLKSKRKGYLRNNLKFSEMQSHPKRPPKPAVSKRQVMSDDHNHT